MAVRGTVRVPGDKSISHRVAMLCALASGELTIEGFFLSEDCLNTVCAIEELGASVNQSGTTSQDDWNWWHVECVSTSYPEFWKDLGTLSQ